MRFSAACSRARANYSLEILADNDSLEVEMTDGCNQLDCEMREIPFISEKQMAQVDHLMENDFEIGLIQMMELAGRNLAQLARTRFLGGDAQGKRVTVLAGSGGNGGGGLVAARRLHAWRAEVEVWLSKPEDPYSGVPAHQLNSLQKLGVLIYGPRELIALGQPDLIVDALVGYRLSGDPRGTVAALIHVRECKRRSDSEPRSPIRARRRPPDAFRPLAFARLRRSRWRCQKFGFRKPGSLMM